MFEQNTESGYFLESLLDVCKPSRIFAPNPKAGRFRDILRWWESRRVLYNIVMLCAGSLSYYIYWHLFDRYAPDPADDGMFPGLGVIVFALLANVAYCIGWISEGVVLLARQRGAPKASPVLLGVGVAFSLVLVALPAINVLRLTHEMKATHAAHWFFK